MQFLLLGLDLLRDTEVHYKASKNKRLHVEISLMKFSSIKSNLEKKKI